MAQDSTNHGAGFESTRVPGNRPRSGRASIDSSRNENGRGGFGGHFRQRFTGGFVARFAVGGNAGRRARASLDPHPAFRPGRAQSLSQEQQRGWNLEYTAGEAGEGTDLDAAIREALTSFPADLLPRLLLISDGKENTGSVTRAAWQAQRLGIPIDTIPLHGRPQPALRLESVTIPTIGFTGEQFPIDLDLSSPEAVSATVEISAEGKLLGSNPVTLEKGRNQIRVHASLAAAGALKLSGAIRAGNSGEIHFDRAVTLRRPRVLYLSDDPAGTESHLMQTLKAAQFDVDRTSDPLRGVLTDYQLVVLNNRDLESLPSSRKDEIEEFVKQGGGLLVIGGERNLYADTKTIEDALDRTLPAKIAPPRSPEGTAVVLIIDKSSSMEGKKIELARLASIGVVDNLRPIDTVGVLIFDNSFQWAVPMRKADDRALIKRLISGIVPDGGTQIAPALAEAYRRVLPSRATFKHIVLLTDGISEEGDSLDLSKEAATQHVTISTVGLGQDVNRAYLEKIASSAGGKSYFLNEPAGLEQILLKDVLEHTGSTAVEKALRPFVSKKVEILDGVGIEDAPALKGYVRFIAKPTADTILKIDQMDPLLVRWQYGLGRAEVFTSDAKSRWAADWVTWNGFDKFWTNIFRDLLPHAETGEAKTEYDSASGDVIVDYQLGATWQIPQSRRPSSLLVPTDSSIRSPLPNSRKKGLSRQDSGGATGRAVSHPPAGGVARFSRSREFTSRNRNCWIMDRTNSCCARSRRLPAADIIQRRSKSSMPAGARNQLFCGCGRDCWALPFCSILRS